MTLDPKTARVTGTNESRPHFLSPLITFVGGASFAASFGPGRYSAFACADFRGEGFTLGAPTEFGVWLADFPVQGTTDIQQVYFGELVQA